MRFPFRNQTESSDCGPACIQMVAAYFGKRLSLISIKQACHLTRLGVCLKDVIDGCQHIGLRTVALHLEVEKLRKMPLPAILYWKQEHYVVLYRITERKGVRYYHIADPGYDRVKLTEQLFMDAWASKEQRGIAIALEPTPTFFEQPEEEQDWKMGWASLKNAFNHLKAYKKKLMGVFVLSGITLCCSFLIPFFLQKVMDEGIGLRDFNWVVLLLLGQLALYIGRQISTVANNYLLFHVGLKIGLDISSRYIWKLVKLPVNLFDAKLGTDLLQRLSDEQTIRGFLTNTISSLLFIILNLLIYSFILCYYNIYIFTIFVIFSILTLGLTRWLLSVRKQQNYAIFAGMGKKRNIENELVYGMMELKINTAYHSFLSKWEKEQKELNRHSKKSLLYESSITGGTALLATLRDTLITGGCAWFVIHDEMTVGIMMTVTYILGQLSSAFSQISTYGNTVQDTAMAYNRMEDILNVPNENDGRTLTLSDNECSGISLQGVSFKYDGTYNPYVLNDISVNIPCGKVTAIVGTSGSGKTTLLKLLLAFYQPNQGCIYLGSKDLKSVDVEDWRKKCGVVMQDGYIFSGTIADNIALEEEVDWTRMENAVRMACLDMFINRLPMKYHTKIGKAGMDLSGGQKQRILIARAVYKKPEYIFFDEATSSLDADNERAIMNNLKEFYVNRTVIIIAHRLSTVKEADNIIVLDKGRMIEQGDHLKLIENHGVYYRLVKNQLELGT